MSGYAQSSTSAGLVPGAFNTGSSTGGSPRGSTDSWVSAPTQGGSRPGTAPKVGASGTVPGFGATKASNLALGRTGGGGGMKLGGTANKAGGVKGKTANTALEEVMGDWDDEGVENAWGTDDLIDVNADEDDWGEFSLALVLILLYLKVAVVSRLRSDTGASGPIRVRWNVLTMISCIRICPSTRDSRSARTIILRQTTDNHS